MMCEMIIGKTVDEAMKITNIDVEQALRDEDATAAIPPQKMHCSVMAYDVIRKAASEYKGVDMDSLERGGNRLPVRAGRACGTVRDVIRINDLKTVEEITAVHEGRGVLQVLHPPGRPRDAPHYLVDILRDVRAEMDREKAKAGPATASVSRSWA